MWTGPGDLHEAQRDETNGSSAWEAVGRRLGGGGGRLSPSYSPRPSMDELRPSASPTLSHRASFDERRPLASPTFSPRPSFDDGRRSPILEDIEKTAKKGSVAMLAAKFGGSKRSSGKFDDSLLVRRGKILKQATAFSFPSSM